MKTRLLSIDEYLSDTNEDQWYDMEIIDKCGALIKLCGIDERRKLYSLISQREPQWLQHLIESLDHLEFEDSKDVLLEWIVQFDDSEIIYHCAQSLKSYLSMLSSREKDIVKDRLTLIRDKITDSDFGRAIDWMMNFF